MKKILLSIMICSLIFGSNLFAQKEKEIKKEFEKRGKIKIKLILGNCIINKSKDNKVHVHLVYDYPDDQFEAILKEKGKSLYFQEKLHGRNPEGDSKWIISIPDDIKVDFNSATGDLTIEGIKAEIDANSGTGNMELFKSIGEFEINSGTGDIIVNYSEGEFDLNSGTGKLEIENSQGNFDANSGTGNVKAKNVTFEDEGDFNSGTGDVEVIAPKGKDFILTINSGTDDAILDMDGQPLKGYFELSAHKRKGRIKCSVKFDTEKEYDNGDGKYVRKSFTKGKDYPRFYISTGTGKAELKK